MDAAKKLLQYGLKGTDLEALVAIGKGEDGGRFGKSVFFLFFFFFHLLLFKSTNEVISNNENFDTLMQSIRRVIVL